VAAEVGDAVEVAGETSVAAEAEVTLEEPEVAEAAAT
jgi:hypothetical protein